jgi:hypothetical protein
MMGELIHWDTGKLTATAFDGSLSRLAAVRDAFAGQAERPHIRCQLDEMVARHVADTWQLMEDLHTALGARTQVTADGVGAAGRAFTRAEEDMTDWAGDAFGDLGGPRP